MNGQLRRSEQLSGRAGVGLRPTRAAPSPSPALTYPPQPPGWAPLREGGSGWPGDPSPPGLECSATKTPWVPRSRSPSPSTPSGPGGPGLAARGPEGEGEGTGAGGRRVGVGTRTLPFVSLSRATSRNPTPSASQAAGKGQALPLGVL